MVELKVYDLLGQEVRTLVNEGKSIGEYSVVWDGKDEFGRPMASGSYFYSLKTGELRSTKRMIFLK